MCAGVAAARTEDAAVGLIGRGNWRRPHRRAATVDCGSECGGCGIACAAAEAKTVGMVVAVVVATLRHFSKRWKMVVMKGSDRINDIFNRCM